MIFSCSPRVELAVCGRALSPVAVLLCPQGTCLCCPFSVSIRVHNLPVLPGPASTQLPPRTAPSPSAWKALFLVPLGQPEPQVTCSSSRAVGIWWFLSEFLPTWGLRPWEPLACPARAVSLFVTQVRWLSAPYLGLSCEPVGYRSVVPPPHPTSTPSSF